MPHRFDIQKTPFSSYGSYWVISYLTEPEEGLYIRDIRHGDSDLGLLFAVSILDAAGKKLPYHLEMTEYCLAVVDHSVLLQFCFADEDTLIAKTGAGARVCLELVRKKYDHINALDSTQDCYELHSYSQEVKALIQAPSGAIAAELPWHRIENTTAKLTIAENTEWTLESYGVTAPNKNKDGKQEWPPYCPDRFASCKIAAQQRYAEFVQRSLPAPDSLGPQKELANYILYSCTVKPEGLLQHYTIYMSNNWMTNVWSWDHAFNSLCLAKNQPQLAYQQFMVFESLQDACGVLPDYANNSGQSFACCKPPVHGLLYGILMRENPYFCQSERLLPVYQMLAAVAGYWEKHRKHKDLYYYNHGNDSGWDNASAFDQGCPLICPDLASYLVCLHQLLADIAQRIPPQAHKQAAHKQQAERIARALVAELWQGQNFVAKKLDGSVVEMSHCLLRLLPLVIAEQLPTAIADKLLADLQDPHQFTPYGFATERTDSPAYQEDGYWRGPIWAPSSLLLIEALANMKEYALAREAGQRFCQLCATGGMAENFHSTTGQGLEDPAFTWTSSVFLYLANQLVKENTA